MRKHRLLFALVLIALPVFLSAQTINYTTSWLGSTYGGTTLWIQDMIDYMEVGADGTVYAYTGWDEGSGGARKGTYKDGKVLPNHTRNINFTQVTDKAGKTWTIKRSGDVSVPFSDNSVTCSDGRKITDVVKPMAIAIANNGMLMVGEYGPRQQILYYNISGSGTPTLDHTFGDEFGTNSGIPGVVAPLKLREITGVGEDAAGNIYVAHNSFNSGCRLESYTPAGKLNWAVSGMFVDNGDFDRTTDGNDIYSKSHHFSMDYSKPVGQQWKDSAITLNRFKYPDDARLHHDGEGEAPTLHPSSAWVRYKDGKKILVVNDMYSSQLRMYRFNYATDGEIAIPSVLYAKRSVKPFLFNLNLFKFDSDPAIQALSYFEKLGTGDEGTTVAFIQGGCYLAYRDVNFGTGKTTFTASTANPGTNIIIGGILELHADSLNGRKIGSVTTSSTGSWASYKLFSSTLTDTITGVHNLYIKFKYPNANRWPATHDGYGQWMWTDGNGNGQMDYGEYQYPGSELSAVGYWVDNAMSIWIFGASIISIPCKGLDAHGNPIYNMSEAITVTAPPLAGIIKRLEYDSDNDVMYILSETKASKFSNWSTNKTTPDWKITLPIAASQSMCIAGSYLFTCTGITANISVFNLADGKYAGLIKPGPEVQSWSGWIDIPYGISAMKRSNGEYVILAEEDGRGKILVYRFSSITPNVPPTVSVTAPKDNLITVSPASMLVTASAKDTDGTISKTKIFIDSTLVSQTTPYTWVNPPMGKHTIFARAIDNYGDSTTSAVVTINITAVGLDPLTAANEISIYPNPAKGKVYIKVPSNTNKITEISIVAMNGKAILKKSNPSIVGSITEIDISAIPNGIYFLQITRGKDTLSSKLVIDK